MLIQLMVTQAPTTIAPTMVIKSYWSNLYWLIMTNLWKPTSSNHLLLKTASKIIKLVILVKQDFPINQMLEIFLIHISQTIKQFHWLISIWFLPCIEILYYLIKQPLPNHNGLFSLGTNIMVSNCQSLTLSNTIINQSINLDFSQWV